MRRQETPKGRTIVDDVTYMDRAVEEFAQIYAAARDLQQRAESAEAALHDARRELGRRPHRVLSRLLRAIGR